VTVPSTLVGVLAGALSVAWRGAPLDEDPQYRARLAAGEVAATGERSALAGDALARARRSTLLFLLGIAVVVLIGMFPQLRPTYAVGGDLQAGADQVSMGAAIMIVMIAVAGLVLLLCKASPDAAVKGDIMGSGVTAVICILGVSWLGSSFFEGNRPTIVDGISGLVQSQPWTFAVGLFVLSSLLFSAATTVVILVPVAVAMALPTAQLVAFYPAANAVFFLPTYGTLIAACSFDRTGTTRIGRFLLNHSFMRPGLVTTTTSIALAWLIGSALL
jgi:anaerobic C4-dicarboxylate transporter